MPSRPRRFGGSTIERGTAPAVWAVGLVRAQLGDPSHPGGTVAIAGALSASAGTVAFDAQIVAVCRECGVRALLTEDRDGVTREAVNPGSRPP